MELLVWFLIFAVYAHLYIIDTRNYELKTKRAINWALVGCLILYIVMAFIYQMPEATTLRLGFLAGIGLVTGMVSAVYIVPVNKRRLTFILIVTIAMFGITAFDSAAPYLKM